MRNNVTILALLLLATTTLLCRAAESCDFDDSALKKLCRKVESQDKYLEKIVDIGYKAETMFRWYSANKDWLTHQRLSRMMKRLLRRAASLNPAENDDFPDDSSSGGASGANTAELEAKLQQMALQLNQTQAQLKQQMTGRAPTAEPSSSSWQQEVEQRINASLTSHQNQMRLLANSTNQSLQHVVSGGEQLAARISKTEKLVQSLKNAPAGCGCNGSSSTTAVTSRVRTSSAEDVEEPSAKSSEDVAKIKHELANEIEQLQLKLQLTASDLEKSINAIQMGSEGALRNFSQSYHEGMKALTTLLDDRLSTAASASYDVITNATFAFGEDLQVLRTAVSQSASQIQFLIGQDLKTVRGLEELRSGTRRHENNIQVVTNQLGELKLTMQDSLNHIRSHFTQTVNEFYNKIVERQNAMSYRLSSVVDELTSVKGRVRNLPNLAPTSSPGEGGAVVVAPEDDDLPPADFI